MKIKETPSVAGAAEKIMSLRAERMRDAAYIAPVLFTLSILLSAGLLFFIQPLLARMVTPLIGGGPSAWVMAAMFFQTIMIAGYLYAHILTRLPRIRHQIGIHLLLWLTSSTTIPLAIDPEWVFDPMTAPQLQTLTLYAMTVGLPFFFLSANAPLIQTWYSRTRGPSADDPYFLYGASNVGSLIALLGFPLVIEPVFGVSAMAMGWSISFIIMGALLFVSAFWTTRSHPDAKTVAPIINKDSDLGQLVRWGMMAFVPSGLMVAVTTKITMDFGSLPMLWIIPLALYLLTYVLGFRLKPFISDDLMSALYPAAIGVMGVLTMTSAFGIMTITSVVTILACFSIIGLHLHRSLYLTRPDTSRLTVFYLTLSIGGAAGGIFNGIVGPMLMDGPYELPVLIMAAAAAGYLAHAHEKLVSKHALSILLVLCIFLLVSADHIAGDLYHGSTIMLVIAFSAMFLVLEKTRTAGFIGISLSCLAFISYDSRNDLLIEQTRNFFGVHKVINEKGLRVYSNGSTIHGAQLVSDLDSDRPRPILYYHQDGPLGEIAKSDAWSGRKVGLVGLGIGSMLAYRETGQPVDIFEIDPAVVQLASNPDYFGFMESYGSGAKVHLGDARLVLEQKQDSDYGMLLIDAYSSDSIPIHLSTLEAMDIFMRHVGQNGVLTFHISNRYYDLTRPLSAAAQALGLRTYEKRYIPDASVTGIGRTQVHAVVVLRPGQEPGFLDNGWSLVTPNPSDIWTDNHANPLRILK